MSKQISIAVYNPGHPHAGLVFGEYNIPNLEINPDVTVYYAGGSNKEVFHKITEKIHAKDKGWRFTESDSDDALGALIAAQPDMVVVAGGNNTKARDALQLVEAGIP